MALPSVSSWQFIFCLCLVPILLSPADTVASQTFSANLESLVEKAELPTSANSTTIFYSSNVPSSSKIHTTNEKDTTIGNNTTEHYTTSNTTTWITTQSTFTQSTAIGTTAANSEDNSTIPQYIGFIAAGVSVLLYGSNFAPVKKFETGDGMFFQWILCGAALLVGIIVQVIRGTRHFYPLVMIGGLVWETGNICVVPIIKTIGMGLGLCIWGMTNLLSGWATSRFGLFGVTPSDKIGNDTLNTVGVVVAVFSSIIFAFVRNEVTPVEISETEPLLNNTPSGQGYGSPGDSLYSNTNNHDQLVFNQRRSRGSINRDPTDTEDNTFIDRLSPVNKRILGIVLSVVSGVLYGQMFTPAVYLQDQKEHSENSLDYVFACFCGIYITSTVYFIIYIIFMKNKPKVYPKAILPGVISGLMWGTATAGWFVANEALSPAISFPIISTGPSIIASLWGIFVFREIRGVRNISILLLGFVFVITGATLTALSEKH
ncbi:transmembrane protein 144-like isoform X2 [Saccostrea echinata]|uniref:transmembrane protein 144-like isoform X2 n=1 Tax=Saccostrea echinata TaxID=191078 RepID=UPI002A828D9B|nr:transmembrane protein 144-like isoform X2 [Saccostrea echinata]